MSPKPWLTIHATAICLNGFAVVLRGKSGSGKSDLALQLIESAGNGLSSQTIHGTLISDDQVELHAMQPDIIVRAPQALRGKLEVRGIGIVEVPNVSEAPLALLVDLQTDAAIERMPDPADLQELVFGRPISRMTLNPARPSAAARIRMALALVLLNQKPL